MGVIDLPYDWALCSSFIQMPGKRHRTTPRSTADAKQRRSRPEPDENLRAQGLCGRSHPIVFFHNLKPPPEAVGKPRPPPCELPRSHQATKADYVACISQGDVQKFIDLHDHTLDNDRPWYQWLVGEIQNPQHDLTAAQRSAFLVESLCLLG